MLLDSNIIIYAALPEYNALRELIARNTPSVSVMSQIEVLGYHRLTIEERRYFTRFFKAATLLAIDSKIITTAISLKQQRKTSLGDAIITATALEHDLCLVTRNSKDFDWIEGLKIMNPID